MSTYTFDTMKLKVLFYLICESSKYIAKYFSLSIFNSLILKLYIMIVHTFKMCTDDAGPGQSLVLLLLLLLSVVVVVYPLVSLE